MNVFLVIVEDRHTDVEVFVFEKQEDAVGYAKEIVIDYDYEPEEDEIVPLDGWIFAAMLSCEGDFVRVEESDVL